MAFKDISNQVFHRLTVLREKLPRTNPVKWVCICECGTEKVIIGSSLKNGSTKSCGCLHVETNKKEFTKHGDYQSKLYAVHRSMLSRCNNPTNEHYSLYGGRGISVSKDWESYETFKEWAINHGYNNNLSIERKDTNGNYCPENCTWESKTHQARNRRKQGNKSSTYLGVSWDSARNKWFVSIRVNQKSISLGRFSDELSAAKARDKYICENNLKGFPLNF